MYNPLLVHRLPTVHFCLDNINLKKELEKAALKLIDKCSPFVVQYDSSEAAVSDMPNQSGHPVASMSRILQGSEFHYPSVEKEDTAIIEAVHIWHYFLADQHFVLVTDQRSVAFRSDNRKCSKY